jgi:DNA repair protein RadC
VIIHLSMIMQNNKARSSHISWELSEKPREKLLEKGASSLSDTELLSIFLRTGVKGKPVLYLADELLTRFDGLRGILEAEFESLKEVNGIGLAKFVQLKAALELSTRFLEKGFKKRDAIEDPGATKRYLKGKLRSYQREVFAVMYLDNQHRLIQYEELFFGTIDSASVHPREVVKRVLALNAAAVIFAHNHPSGRADPSQADQRITDRLKSALSLVDVRVLDHMIIGDTEVLSFAESGLL